MVKKPLPALPWYGQLPPSCFEPGEQNIPHFSWSRYPISAQQVETCLRAHFPKCLELHFTTDAKGRQQAVYGLRPELLVAIEKRVKAAAVAKALRCFGRQRTVGQLITMLEVLYFVA